MGFSSPECIRSRTRSSTLRPRVPIGWLAPYSSTVKPCAAMVAIASASPSAIAAVVLAVGDRPRGHASCLTEASSATSASSASVDEGRPHILMIAAPRRLIAGRRFSTSSVSPLLDNIMTTSAPVTMPRSPCIASAGCIKKAGVPVLARVPASLRATAPDLPMPHRTARPSISSRSWTAWTNSSPNRSARPHTASASIASVLRACLRISCSVILG